MSLYWPEANVAIDIIDDPGRRPFDIASHPDATVIEATCEQLADFDANEEIAHELMRHLGVEPPEDSEDYRTRRRKLHQMLFDTLPPNYSTR